MIVDVYSIFTYMSGQWSNGDFDLKWLLHKTEQNSEQKIEAKPIGPSAVAPWPDCPEVETLWLVFIFLIDICKE